MNFEDVSNSDILSAFASIKKVNEQRKEERFVHSPAMEGGEQEQLSQQQEVYEPGFNSKLTLGLHVRQVPRPFSKSK